MSTLFKCTIGTFPIVECFEAVDLLFNDGEYLAVSCIEKNNRWLIEVLSSQRIDEAKVLSILGRYNCSVVRTEKIPETNWLKKCFENFKPITVGGFYLFGPHLRTGNIPKNKIGIEIAAATAFGSGEHPTTNRCLIACQTFFDRKVHKTALDIGCGSCILSIALAKLGARDVTACDNDAEAVRVAVDNVKLNKVSGNVIVFQNKGCEFSHQRYDFIVANILAEPLISMSQSVIYSLNGGGILVLSGFNSDDLSVEEKYRSLGMSVKYIYEYDNWSTVVLQKCYK